tara:strand:- start:494 stop:1537 length:1044 start_codon:yes stop_codon:yes gene_type:complete
MKIQIQWEFDLPCEATQEDHDRFAEAEGVPLIVDMCDYLHDPESASTDQITDALSDEHGWLIQNWKVLEACKTDNTDGIITHQHQPLTPQEDNMENINSTTPNSNEVSMSQQEMIVQMFQSFLTDGGSPKVTEFKKHLNNLINSDIKQLCSRSGKAADGNDWRSVLKARFGGKGAKWVLVPLQEINPTISEFESQGIDCDNFKTFIERKGAAWIRFAGPRIDSQGQQAAAFEVRTGGSKIDHPKQLHFIPVSVLEETIRPMEGTPHSLKLEVIAQPEEETPVDLGAVCDEIIEEMTEGIETESVESSDEVNFDMSQLDDLDLDDEDSNLFESFDELMEDEEGFSEII